MSCFKRLLFGISAVTLLGLCPDVQTNRTIVPLHLEQGVDGHTILNNVDAFLEEHRQLSDLSSSLGEFSSKNAKPELSFLGFGKKTPAESAAASGVSAAELAAIHPNLAKVWNNTAMIFGASANGIGVGTTFMISKTTANSALFVTNFHVIEAFCNVPAEEVFAEATTDEFKYECQSLFVLHDVAINTQNNQVQIDGKQPWKSEVTSLQSFDKRRDLAVFEITLPADFVATLTDVDSGYDLVKPLFVKKEARLLPNLPAAKASDSVAMESLELYIISYSVPVVDGKNSANLIKKSWHRGAMEGLRAFENEQKLGLVPAIKHSVEVTPGSSGGPLVLSDGRIIGVNASLEIKQFYVKHLFASRLETYISYYAIPTVFLAPLLIPKAKAVPNE